MVDIPNHEDSLRELSKTSLVNNVTIILCWSAAEAARYLELYKSYENANFSAIRGQQPSSYTERLEDFVTVPRSLNKSDAVALVANFGSLRNAVNAEPEQLGMIAGWGGVKVKRWTEAVEEPFRVKKAVKRGQAIAAPRETTSIGTNEAGQPLSVPRPAEKSSAPPSRPVGETSTSDPAQGQFHFLDELDDEDAEDALLAAALEESKRTSQPGEPVTRTEDDNLSGGIAAALARLRNDS
jgi:DNA excision repair protein ERCC-1